MHSSLVVFGVEDTTRMSNSSRYRYVRLGGQQDVTGKQQTTVCPSTTAAVQQQYSWYIYIYIEYPYIITLDIYSCIFHSYYRRFRPSNSVPVQVWTEAKHAERSGAGRTVPVLIRRGTRRPVTKRANPKQT